MDDGLCVGMHRDAQWYIKEVGNCSVLIAAIWLGGTNWLMIIFKVQKIVLFSPESI